MKQYSSDPGTQRVIEELIRLIDALSEESECDFDHHGGCQAHMFLELEPGMMCPNETARQVVREAGLR